jgi:hypothetical protein
MVIHPEFQRKAQEEIDRVIGNDRFPTLADQANLPYVDALVKEAFRWKPVGPLGKSALVRSYETARLLQGTNFKGAH